jgi:hypothetical protein
MKRSKPALGAVTPSLACCALVPDRGEVKAAPVQGAPGARGHQFLDGAIGIGASGVGVVVEAAAGAQASPQQELVGSQQKRLRNSRCRRPSLLHVSQGDEQVVLQVALQGVSQVEQLQVMLLKQRWCNRLSLHFSSLQGLHALLGQAGLQGCSHTVTGTLRHTLTWTSSGTHTLTFLQTVHGTVSHTVYGTLQRTV